MRITLFILILRTNSPRRAAAVLGVAGVARLVAGTPAWAAPAPGPG